MGHSTNFHMTSHNMTNHICEIDGDTAHRESYVMGGLYWLEGEKTTMAFGRYLDRLERRNGEWRMHTRKCTIEMSADTDGSWVHSANVKGFLIARWDGMDPSYDRPYMANREGLRWQGHPVSMQTALTLRSNPDQQAGRAQEADAHP
jgi:SnoaL-like domain